MLDFLPETENIRISDWTIAPIPEELQDRRVEITGPVERKMIINALNSGAKVFMADFEDSNSPTWNNVIQGQVNLRDAVNRSILFTNHNGKLYSLNDKPAVLMIRPRGWHLVEKNVLIDGEPISGSIFDFGLYFFHNVKSLIENGRGPYFYLPKLESNSEARLWNDIFIMAQNELGLRSPLSKQLFLSKQLLLHLKWMKYFMNCGNILQDLTAAGGITFLAA